MTAYYAEFWWKVGFEDRFQQQNCCCRADRIGHEHLSALVRKRFAPRRRPTFAEGAAPLSKTSLITYLPHGQIVLCPTISTRPRSAQPAACRTRNTHTRSTVYPRRRPWRQIAVCAIGRHDH